MLVSVNVKQVNVKDKVVNVNVNLVKCCDVIPINVSAILANVNHKLVNVNVILMIYRSMLSSSMLHWSMFT